MFSILGCLNSNIAILMLSARPKGKALIETTRQSGLIQPHNCRNSVWKNCEHFSIQLPSHLKSSLLKHSYYRETMRFIIAECYLCWPVVRRPASPANNVNTFNERAVPGLLCVKDLNRHFIWRGCCSWSGDSGNVHNSRVCVCMRNRDDCSCAQDGNWTKNYTWLYGPIRMQSLFLKVRVTHLIRFEDERAHRLTDVNFSFTLTSNSSKISLQP